MVSSPHNRKELNGVKIKIGDETLIASNSVRNLGVVMDCVFNMEAHITSVCQTCYFHLSTVILERYGAILTMKLLHKFIHAFVTSKLDYCNSVFYKLPDKSLNRL